MTTLVDATQVDYDLETECVVIGAGAAGLVCALRLSEHDIDTWVMERDTQATGSTSMSSGFIPAAGTHQQRRQGIVDSVELFASDIQRKAANQADSAVTAAVTQAIAPALDWLETAHGFAWQVLDDFLYPGHSAHRMHSVAGKTGADLQQQLLNTCASSSVSIVTQARVDALVVDQSAAVARICGVRVQRPEGLSETIRAGHVVLSCSGYGGNPELIERFIPEMTLAHYYGHAGNTGDAVQWAQQLGLPLRHMSAYQGHGSVAVGHNILITWALIMEGGIQVNTLGERFSNEHQGYSEQAINVLAQPAAQVWNIYDQRLHTLGMGFPDYAQAFAAGAVLCADDASALAAQTGLPGKTLSATIEQVQNLSLQNRSDEYGRVFKADTVLEPPFYAVKVGAAVFHTQGGLTIDNRARVLNAQHKVVPNLFATGGAACGVSGARVEGYLSGNGLLSAVGLGFIAANTVAAERLKRV